MLEACESTSDISNEHGSYFASLQLSPLRVRGKWGKPGGQQTNLLARCDLGGESVHWRKGEGAVTLPDLGPAQLYRMV